MSRGYHRYDIPDDVCEELEVRENLDRKELTHKERVAHTLVIGAVMQQRQSKRKHISNGSIVESDHDHPVKATSGVQETCKVANATAAALGVLTCTVNTRVGRTKGLIGKTINLETTPPEELMQAARDIRALPVEKISRPSNNGPPSKGTERKGGGVSISLNICPTDAPAFADWLRTRYKHDIFTLDNIRAYRDALIKLVADLEAEV